MLASPPSVAAPAVPALPGTLRPCSGDGVHGWLEPAVVPTSSRRLADWACPNCDGTWRTGTRP